MKDYDACCEMWNKVSSIFGQFAWILPYSLSISLTQVMERIECWLDSSFEVIRDETIRRTVARSLWSAHQRFFKALCVSYKVFKDTG